MEILNQITNYINNFGTYIKWGLIIIGILIGIKLVGVVYKVLKFLFNMLTGIFGS